MKNPYKKLFSLILMGAIISCSARISNKTTSQDDKNDSVNIEDSIEQRIDQLFKQWDREDTPGASVAVVKDGQLAFSKGYGQANLEYGIPISTTTIFHIASVSKQLTAFSIALLADQGRLALDDDIRKYLSEIPNFGTRITIRHLVHHTSGLRDQLLALAGWREDDVRTEKQIMKMVQHQKSLNFEPGEEFLYCNTGYFLMAEIVERVTGKSFPEWTKENIFEPLQMNHTFFNDSHQKVIKNKAYSYGKDGTGYKKGVLNLSYTGPTGLYTTAEDLARWAINFEKIELGNKSIMQQMHQRGVLNNGDTIEYSFGQSASEYKGLRMIWHRGADAEYRSYLCRFPDQDLAVIVLSNHALINPRKKAMKIADIYLKDHIKENTKQEAKSIGNKRNSYALQSNEDYVGRYELMENLVLKVWVDDNQLKGHITGKRDTHKLKPLSESVFEMPSLNNAQVEFKFDKDSKIGHIIYKEGNRSITAPKLVPFDPKSIDLNAYTGTYFSEELTTIYSLTIQDGKLVAKNKRLDDIILTLIEPDFFRGDQWFFKDVEVLRDVDNQIIGLSISSTRARNQRFDKTKK